MADPIADFFAAWSRPDAGERRALIAQAVTGAAHYADPRTEAPLSGPQEIADYVGAFTAAAPGATAEVVDRQTRHGTTRATIAFRMADGMEQLGQYFVETDADGRITRMTGFTGTGAPK